MQIYLEKLQSVLPSVSVSYFGTKARRKLLHAAFKSQEATASLAASKEISMDAAFVAVSSECIFFVEKVFCFAFLA